MVNIYPTIMQFKCYASIAIPTMMPLEQRLDDVSQVIVPIIKVQPLQVVIECSFSHPL